MGNVDNKEDRAFDFYLGETKRILLEIKDMTEGIKKADDLAEVEGYLFNTSELSEALRWARFYRPSEENIIIEDLDLSGAFLSLLNLQGLLLRNVNLSGARLEGVDFESAKLHQVNLEGAKITKCFFEKSLMNDVSFRGASFFLGDFNSSGVVRCDFEDAIIGTDLRDSAFRDCSFLSACFLSDCTLYSSGFYDCAFDAATLMVCHATKSTFERCSMTGIDAHDGAFDRCSFDKASLEGSCFRNSDLSETNFRNSELAGADFSGASFSWFDYDFYRHSKRVSGITFENCEVSGVNFGGGKLAKSSQGGKLEFLPVNAKMFSMCRGIPFGVEGSEEGLS